MLMLVLAGPVVGQAPFSQLAVTDDGQQVVFRSGLVLKTSVDAAATPDWRFYRIGPQGVSLLAERRSITAVASSYGFGLTAPQTTGDGSLVGFTFLGVCTNFSDVPPVYGHCDSGKPSEAEGILLGSPQTDLGPGQLQLSRNGQWALITPPFNFQPRTATLIDLSSGKRAVVPVGPFENLGPTIASDGTLLIETGDKAVGANHFALWKEGKQTALSDLGRAVVLSDNGRVVLWIDHWSDFGPATLGARDLQTGRVNVLFSSPDRREVAVFMGISNDGMHVFYIRTPTDDSGYGTAYVADTSTGESQAIDLPSGEFAYNGALSGAGDAAFLVTTAGRIVKVAWPTHTITTLVPATPNVGFQSGLVPGSLARMRGIFGGFVGDWSSRILFDERPVPVLYTRSGEVGIQVPWELPWGDRSFRLNVPDDSPFQQFHTVPINLAAPYIESVDPGTTSVYPIKLVRGDWSGLLDGPPQPGDIVNLYMTGLGPVDNPPPTGSVTPSTILSPIQFEITCGFNSIPNLTLFAGLAPGTTGVYQVSMQVPAGQANGSLDWITCIVQGPHGFRSTLTWGLMSVSGS